MLKKLNPVMFADDSNLFISDINVDDLFFYMDSKPKQNILYLIQPQK